MMKNYVYLREKFWGKCMDPYSTIHKWEIRMNAQLCQLYKRKDVVQLTRGAKIE
jgi:hypothetical protein